MAKSEPESGSGFQSGNYLYQKYASYFATVCDGVEALLADELKEQGARKVKMVYRGVYFEAAPADLYRLNYVSRLATRIYAPLIKFDCHSTKYLYNTARRVLWEDFMSLETTFAIQTTVSHSAIRHSRYAGQCLKDAIADVFRKFHGARPSVDTENPDVWLNLHIQENKATISFDTSGGSLHKRGYRVSPVEAPMQETVAAAMLRMTGWDGTRPLFDPMCGSGTLLTEALMGYCRVPPAFKRQRFGFERLPDFHEECWKTVKEEVDGEIRALPKGLISGSDVDSQSVQAAVLNLREIPSGTGVKIRQADLKSLGNLENAVVVCNPPYGIRLGDKRQAASIYRQLGQFLKGQAGNLEAYIYFGDPELIPAVGLEPVWEKPLKNGGLKGKLAKYAVSN